MKRIATVAFLLVVLLCGAAVCDEGGIGGSGVNKQHPQEPPAEKR